MRSQFLALTFLALTTALPTPNPNPELLFPPLSPTEPLSHPLYPRNVTDVARAGGVLNAAAAAEANVRDDTATRAFTSAAIKSSSGQCLFIDPAAGDFRENLIPVQLKTCDGSAEQGFDIITKGKHNQADGSILIVSSVVCLPFPCNDFLLCYIWGKSADVNTTLRRRVVSTSTPGALRMIK